MELEIENVSHTYKNGKKALSEISTSLTPGVYGLLGPNGAGKSTLMNIITDNLRPTAGEVSLDGNVIWKNSNAYRARLGYMPQQQGLYSSFTGTRFLWYMAALKGLSHREAKTRVNELLELVNLKDAADRRIGGYSGGMKQRLLIAQALLNEPDVLVLDEPTAGLDPKERIRIRNFISEIAADKIVLLATHVVTDVEVHRERNHFIETRTHSQKSIADGSDPRNGRAGMGIFDSAGGDGRCAEKISGQQHYDDRCRDACSCSRKWGAVPG